MEMRDKILMKIEKGMAQDEDALRNLLQAEDAELIGNEEFLVGQIVETLCGKGEFKESLLFYVEALKKYPHHLALNLNYRTHLGRVVAELELMGFQDPASFQFRSLYELLKELGVLSYKCHLLAIVHYRQNGCKELADEISRNLSLTAPHSQGSK